GTPGLHEQLSLRVRRSERVELGSLRGQRRIDVVDRADFDHRRPPALIEAGRCVDQVGFAKQELSDEVRRGGGVTGFGEIAVGRAPDEARVARGFEPSPHLTGRDDLNRLRLMLLLLLLLLVLSATASTALSASPAATVTSSSVAALVESSAS